MTAATEAKATRRAKTVQEMCDYPFRSGWLEADLKNARETMAIACDMLEGLGPRAQIALEFRIKIIDETIALIEEANTLRDSLYNGREGATHEYR